MVDFWDKWGLISSGKTQDRPHHDYVEVRLRYFRFQGKNIALLTSDKEFFSISDLRKITRVQWDYHRTPLECQSGDIFVSTHLYRQRKMCVYSGGLYHPINLNKLIALVESEKFKVFQSHVFSWPRTSNPKVSSLFTKRVIDRIQSNVEIPPLPTTTQELLDLKSYTHPPLDRLVDLIEQDPILSAQVLSWARSAFYGYRGDVSSVKEAIVRVLGVDIVLNLCLCLSLKKSFNLPSRGPLGWKRLVERSLATAELSKMIARESNLPLDENYLYLGGLLCDIGYFLLGHAFKPHFDVLQEELTVSPQIDPCLLEFHLFEFSHQHLGTWLLSKWNFPTEVLACVQWHHHAHVAIPHALYPKTVLMARYVLSSYGLSDEYKSADEMKEVIEQFGPLEKWHDQCHHWFDVENKNGDSGIRI